MAVQLVNVSMIDVALQCHDGTVVVLPRSKALAMDVELKTESMAPLRFVWQERALTCDQTRTVIGGLKEPVPPVMPGVLYIASIVTYNAAKALGRTDVCTVDMAKMVRDQATGKPLYSTGITWP